DGAGPGRVGRHAGLAVLRRVGVGRGRRDSQRALREADDQGLTGARQLSAPPHEPVPHPASRMSSRASGGPITSAAACATRAGAGYWIRARTSSKLAAKDLNMVPDNPANAALHRELMQKAQQAQLKLLAIEVRYAKEFDRGFALLEGSVPTPCCSLETRCLWFTWDE